MLSAGVVGACIGLVLFIAGASCIVFIVLDVLLSRAGLGNDRVITIAFRIAAYGFLIFAASVIAVTASLLPVLLD